MLRPEQIQDCIQRSAKKMKEMRELISSYGSALVAFSGGVDSTLVLKVASEQLGPKVLALTAVSPSLPVEEERAAHQLATGMGIEHVTVDSSELSNPQYAQNPSNRCYFCKTELYDLCGQKRAELGLAVVMDGFNADDLRDHRPGQQAAREHEIRSPLAQVGLTKDEIRSWSFALGLPNWDKPQMPCLASRIPYGTEVTRERLAQIGAAEADLRNLGLRAFRVRYHGGIARIEVSEEEYEKFTSREFGRRVVAAVKSRGFQFAVLDLEPFRSGRLNEAAGILPEDRRA